MWRAAEQSNQTVHANIHSPLHAGSYELCLVSEKTSTWLQVQPCVQCYQQFDRGGKEKMKKTNKRSKKKKKNIERNNPKKCRKNISPNHVTTSHCQRWWWEGGKVVTKKDKRELLNANQLNQKTRDDYLINLCLKSCQKGILLAVHHRQKVIL